MEAPGKAIDKNKSYDTLINADIQLSHQDELQTARVVRRTTSSNSKMIGRYDRNPILNSIIYEVEFPDGQVKEYAENILSENMLSQVDSDKFSTSLFEGIIDFKKSE